MSPPPVGLRSNTSCRHDVEGVAPGAYRWHGDRLQQRRQGQQRDLAAHLCFDRPLGGDSAYTVFHASDLDEVLGALGGRGYRAAQLEAGIAAGRLALAAFTLGYGATGLTFYDEAVSQHFATQAACMLVTSVGVPDYRNTPGGRPGAMGGTVVICCGLRWTPSPRPRWETVAAAGGEHCTVGRERSLGAYGREGRQARPALVSGHGVHTVLRGAV